MCSQDERYNIAPLSLDDSDVDRDGDAVLLLDVCEEMEGRAVSEADLVSLWEPPSGVMYSVFVAVTLIDDVALIDVLPGDTVMEGETLGSDVVGDDDTLAAADREEEAGIDDVMDGVITGDGVSDGDAIVELLLELSCSRLP